MDAERKHQCALLVVEGSPDPQVAYDAVDDLLSALDAAEARAAELQAENESLKRRVQDEIRRSDDSMAHYVAAELRTKDAKARAVAAEERVRELEPYAKFGRMFVEKVGMDALWWGDEWSEAVMPIAVQAGIAERVPYDPEMHGEGVEAEPGDEIWVWLPLKAQGSGE